MKLIVPHTGELKGADARLIRLAEFLGIRCETLHLNPQVQSLRDFERAVLTEKACLVINPKVMAEWTGGNTISSALAVCLTSLFPHLLVHALTPHRCAGSLLAHLSRGMLLSVEPVADKGRPYEISRGSKDICGPFSGLSFGPINPSNDRVLEMGADIPAIRKLICIGGNPFMAACKHDKAEVLFLASEDTVDPNRETPGGPLGEYFSRFVPHAMALRYIFGSQSWQPREHHASLIIDDPLLKKSYGYLNFDTLLQLMVDHKFHTTIAFIPHNYKRTSTHIARMFRENKHRLSICFHGNDHTEGEFASSSTTLLNTLLASAEKRMKAHEEVTGIHCQRLMVFPKELYSKEAMDVMKARNFHAGVSSRLYAAGMPVDLTIGDYAQPATLRHGGMALFQRMYVNDVKSQDIAFNLFFGRPVLIVEHHHAFKRTEPLLAVVEQINSIAPGILWSNLESAAENSILQKRLQDGTLQIRAYSSKVRVTNDTDSSQRVCLIGFASPTSSVDTLLWDGAPCVGIEYDDFRRCALTELPARVSMTLSCVYGNRYDFQEGLSFRWRTRALVRRRLSEIRDNYLSKNEYLLTSAKAVLCHLSKPSHTSEMA